MFKQYKKSLILSSLVILLPIAAGYLLRDSMVSFSLAPWASDPQAGSAHSAFAIAFLPLSLLVAHWLVLFITWKDPRNQGISPKVFRLLLWLMPVVSLYCSAILFCAACGYDLTQGAMITVPLGLLFMAIGNYLPKCKQNHTVGIRIPWTLANEENWNKTHRFGGRCMMVGGFATMLCVFLPGNLKIYGLIVIVAATVLLPMGYSYRIYRQHRSQGIAYPKVYAFGSKKAGISSGVFLALLLVFVGVMLFTGDIRYTFGDTAFTIDADFYPNLTVSYDKIDSVTLHPGNVPGTRTAGFGSPRLLMGTFQNDIYGLYSRYTYGKPESCVILTSGDRVLVLSAKTAAETEVLYQKLLAAAK